MIKTVARATAITMNTPLTAYRAWLSNGIRTRTKPSHAPRPHSSRDPNAGETVPAGRHPFLTGAQRVSGIIKQTIQTVHTNAFRTDILSASMIIAEMNTARSVTSADVK